VSLAIVGVRKFWTRSATLVSLIIAAILVALEFVLVGVGYRSATTGSTDPGATRATFDWLLTFPAAFDAVIAITFEFVAIIGLIYVATAAGSEWSWGTLKVAVARGQSRWRYTLATYASLGIILFFGLLITFIVGLVAAVVGGTIAGLSIGNPFDAGQLGQALVKLGRCWIAVMALTSLGYAVAMVFRSQMAGIGTVIGYFLASLILPSLPLPDVVKEVFKYLPFNISSDAIGFLSPDSTGKLVSTAMVDPNLALLVAVGWLVGLVGIACIFVERSDITG
jgi:ABC-type transport system involved in multi-copper enzyme maturation permease subunit